ncbi:MAG TPA: DUF2007 domain-containing protein [Chitinophagales bacterium]|nr:DUF2007 domain-containing protein [Chitinophagales bacterium]HNM32492.1 DUF2007 domain-containing protein [Chitinophagales bacterium]
MIRIATFYNLFEAELAKIKLENHQIYCFIKNEHLAQLQFGIANFELMVNEDDKELALYYLENDADDLDKSIDDLTDGIN